MAGQALAARDQAPTKPPGLRAKGIPSTLLMKTCVLISAPCALPEDKGGHQTG